MIHHSVSLPCISAARAKKLRSRETRWELGPGAFCRFQPILALLRRSLRDHRYTRTRRAMLLPLAASLLFLLLPPCRTLPRTQCEPREFFRNGFCFAFEERALVWSAARSACADSGGDLVSVTDPAENHFLHRRPPGWVKVARRVKEDRTVSVLSEIAMVWLGWRGANFSAGPKLRWSDGTASSFRNVDLFTEKEEAESGKLRCLAMNRLNGRWILLNCESRLAFACKRRSSAIGQCPEHFLPFGSAGKCVSASKPWQRLNFTQAAAFCRSQSSQHFIASLPDLEDMEEQAAFTALLLFFRNDLWLGLRRRGRRFLLSDGRRRAEFFFWDSGEMASGDCAFVQGRPPSTELGMRRLGRWRTTPCRVARAAICMARPLRPLRLTPLPPPDGGPCPSVHSPRSLLLNFRFCLRVVHRALSWADAKRNCESAGGALVAFPSSYEQAVAQFAAISAGQTGMLWFSMSEEGRRLWHLRAQRLNVPYRRRVILPTDFSKNRFCPALTERGDWRLEACDRRLPSLCILNSSSGESAVHSGPKTDSWRINSWVRHGPYSYLLSNISFQSLAGARRFCNGFGANSRVLVIDNAQEAAFVESFSTVLLPHLKTEPQDRLWLNLERVGTNWLIEGERPLRFATWDFAEPKADERCVLISSHSGWAAQPCVTHRAYPAICRRLMPVLNTSLLNGAHHRSFLFITIIAFLVFSGLGVLLFLVFYYHGNWCTQRPQNFFGNSFMSQRRRRFFATDFDALSTRETNTDGT